MIFWLKLGYICCGLTQKAEPELPLPKTDPTSTSLTPHRKRSTSVSSTTRNPLLGGTSSSAFGTPAPDAGPFLPDEMLLPASAELIGKLKRPAGSFKKLQTFLYVKTGIFLEEYAEKDDVATKIPLAAYDLSNAIVAQADRVEGFVLTLYVGIELTLYAENETARSKWVTVINSVNAVSDYVNLNGEKPKHFAAALIAPIRRRHMSLSMSVGRKGSAPKTPTHPSNRIRKDEPFKMIGTLRVHVMEGDGIGGRDRKKKPNPYGVVVVDGFKRALTSTKHSTTNPFWAEEFFFDSDITHETSTLAIFLNNHDKQSESARLGKVIVDLNQIRHGRPVDQWYMVHAPDKSPTNKNVNVKRRKGSIADSAAHTRSSSVDGASSTVTDGGYGLVRLKITLTLEKIMPFSEYRQLLELIIDPELTVAEAVAKVATAQLDEVAGTLVNIFALNNRVTHFVRTLTDIEIAKTDRAAIIFRGNSLGTKVIDMYMKMVGMDYLHQTLVDVIRAVVADKESLEIDPARLEKGEDVKKNLKRLMAACENVFTQIQKSVDTCPQEMKRVFGNIRNGVIRKFKDGDEKLLAVSGFIFLRFFCPAILNPTLFGLVPDQQTGRAARSLTLVAKTMQSLANLAPSVEKEPYMQAMASFVDDHVPVMRELITQFSTPLSNDDLDSRDAYLDDRDLSRELSALQRHCVEKFGELKQLANSSQDETLAELFPVLTRLEQRQFEYERQYAIEYAQKLATQTLQQQQAANPRLKAIAED